MKMSRRTKASSERKARYINMGKRGEVKAKTQIKQKNTLDKNRGKLINFSEIGGGNLYIFRK